MATPNRSALIVNSHKILKKHFEPHVETHERSVLECLLFGCYLENADRQKAEEAYANATFDKVFGKAYEWNELRVTAVTELAERMSGLPDPRTAATHFKQTLHSIFESQYSFDLEHLKKQNLGKTTQQLLVHEGTTPFTVRYTIQYALGGHAIPIDRGALDVFYIVGIIDEKEKEKKQVPGLERAILKNKGQEYGSLLHQLAAMLVASPFSPQVRSILLELDPECQPRLPKRKSRKKKPAAKPAAKPADKSAKKTATPKAVAKPQTAGKKATGKKQTAKKTPTKKTPANKTAAKKTTTKKAPIKKAPIKKAPIKKAPIKKAPIKKTPVKTTAAQKTTTKKTTKPTTKKKSGGSAA